VLRGWCNGFFWAGVRHQYLAVVCTVMNFPVQQNSYVLAGYPKIFQLSVMCGIPDWVATNFTTLVCDSVFIPSSHCAHNLFESVAK
jgi:hypothetical protein